MCKTKGNQNFNLSPLAHCLLPTTHGPLLLAIYSKHYKHYPLLFAIYPSATRTIRHELGYGATPYCLLHKPPPPPAQKPLHPIPFHHKDTPDTLLPTTTTPEQHDDIGYRPSLARAIRRSTTSRHLACISSHYGRRNTQASDVLALTIGRVR